MSDSRGTEHSEAAARFSITAQVFSLTVSRLVMTTAARMLFPFLPQFARGLGVTLTQLQRITALLSVAGLVAPFIVPLSERLGRKPFFYASFILFTGGCLLAALFAQIELFTVSIILMALGQALFDPMMRTHLGDVVPFARRGRAVAYSELSWSMALLVGAPLIGWLLVRRGWQAPFGWLAFAGLGALLLLYIVLPEARQRSSTRLAHGVMFRSLRHNKALALAAAYVFLIMIANMMIFASYAGWMEQQFGIAVTGLGLAAAVLGFAELGGELLAGYGVDRFGSKVVALTAVLSAAGYFLFPLLARDQWSALAGLFFMFIAFEMSFIAVVPTFTELLPRTRSVSLAVLSFVPPLARAAGLLLVAPMQQLGGFHAVSWLAALLALAATIVFSRVADHTTT